MKRFVQVDRETDYLLPPSVDEWLPGNHLARFVVDVIDQLDLSKLTGAYAGRGSAAHHPSVLLGLLGRGLHPGLPLHFHERFLGDVLRKEHVPGFAKGGHIGRLLVGEGFLKIVNQTVPAALKKLGYQPEHVVIGKIARLFHLKGHADVVEAARKKIAKMTAEHKADLPSGDAPSASEPST